MRKLCPTCGSTTTRGARTACGTGGAGPEAGCPETFRTLYAFHFERAA